MFSDSNHTIFDNVKAHRILNGNIPEIEVDVKPFHINKDKLDTHIVVSEYKQPTFHFKLDNDLLDFYGYPDLSLSSNPEYRYKYPKLSQEEFSRQMRQTEEGTPNQLNQFLRQDATGEKLEDIKAQDNAYQEGLKQIDKMINEDTATFKKLYNEWDPTDPDAFDKIAQAENKISEREMAKTKYKESNPVLKKIVKQKPVIRPALPPAKTPTTSTQQKIQKNPYYNIPDATRDVFPIPSKLYKPTPTPPKPTAPPKPPSTPTTPAQSRPASPIKSRPASPAKSRPTTPAKSRPASPAKATPAPSGKPTGDEDYDSDTTTVNNDTITVADNLKPYYQKAQNILTDKKYKDLPNSTNIANTNPKLYNDLNDLITKITGKPSDIKKIGTLRKKLMVNFS